MLDQIDGSFLSSPAKVWGGGRALAQASELSLSAKAWG